MLHCSVVVINILIWDEWNRGHIALHGVTPSEVEQVCEGNPAPSETYDGRIRLVGPTHEGRMLTIILAPKGEDSFYTVTARPASRKERRNYQERIGGEKAA